VAKAKKSAAKKPMAKKAPAKKAVAKKAAPKKAAQKAPAKKAVVAKAKSKVAAKPASKAKAKPAAKSSAKPSAKPAPKAAVQAVSKSATKPNANMKWDQFLTPLDDRVIVQVSEGEKMTAGGLYIPDTVSDTSGNFKGLVLVAGRGHRDDKGKIHAMDVQVGDSIVFSAFAGAKMDLMGQEVRILRESEIMGIVTKK